MTAAVLTSKRSSMAQSTQLLRMRRCATGLLILMALALAAARLGMPRYPWLAALAAFAEAALVGGLADWFAVVVLFRHPFGIPLPHTAILPRNKERIAASVSNFLQQNFMTESVLRNELARIDLAITTARWLARRRHRRSLARQLAAAAPPLLHLIEDESVCLLLRHVLGSAQREVKLAPLLANMLRALTADGQHMLILERVLGIVARALDQNRPYIRQKVHDNSPRWLPRAFDEKFFERLMEGVHGILQEIGDEDSEWRQRFQAAIDDLIAHLASSTEYEARLHQLLETALSNPLVLDYATQVWHRIRQRLLDDATDQHSSLAAFIERALALASQALLRDAALRERINDLLQGALIDIISQRRQMIADIVLRVMASWDADTVAQRLELQVGADLQFIRINGTLVGGLAGLALYALGQLR
jgi:uncharacterized membrane-anchored protein YjiN (DUF445 family)